MKASDLNLITRNAKLMPELLPHMISVYQLGYKQSKIDGMKSCEITDIRWGINYGSEMSQSN